MGDTVLVKVKPKLKLDHTYHGPYRVYKVTATNVKVKPVSTPDVEPRTISLRQISKYKGNFLANQFWYGRNISRPRKQRTVRKRNPRPPTTSTTDHCDLVTQTVQPDYRT